MNDGTDQICFFIAPIGEPGTDIRENSDQVLEFIVRAAVSPLGFNAIRADEIAEPGIITSQVLERIVESPLVIADLTGHNPNVFYELAIRHAIRKPFVQIIRKGETIPFDVATARTVRYGLDLRGAADAADDITHQVESLQADPSNLETPISISLDIQSLRAVADPQFSGLHHVLPLLEDINSAVHNNSNEITRLMENTHPSAGTRPIVDMAVHRAALTSANPYGFIASVGGMRDGAPWLYELGVTTYSEALAGRTDSARNMLHQMIQLIEARFPGSKAFVQQITPQLSTLLERLISTLQTSPMTDVDDLPF